MVTPSVPGAINITDLSGEEVVSLQSGAGSTQTTTGAIGALGGGKPAPFFGTALETGWVRPGLDIGGSGDNFTLWFNQGGQAVGIGTDSPPSNGNPVAAGTHYAPGDTVTLAGGTLLPAGGLPTTAPTELTVTDTELVSATIVAAGTGGTPGSAQVIGTTGTGSMFVLDVTINGSGHISSIDDINDPGDYTVNPTVLTDEPVADNSSSGITGATVSVVMGALQAVITNAGAYATPPSNPVSQGSTSGSGTGATWNLLYTALATVTDGDGGLPLVIEATFPVNPGNNLNGAAITALLKPIGAPPWTIADAAATFGTALVSFGALPLVLYNSGNDRAVVVNGPGTLVAAIWQILHYENASIPNAGSSSPTVEALGYSGLGYFSWWRVRNDGTTLSFDASAEGVVFVPVTDNNGSQSGLAQPPYTETLESFIGTVTHVGFGIDRAMAVDMLSILWNWVQS